MSQLNFDQRTSICNTCAFQDLCVVLLWCPVDGSVFLSIGHSKCFQVKFGCASSWSLFVLAWLASMCLSGMGRQAEPELHRPNERGALFVDESHRQTASGLMNTLQGFAVHQAHDYQKKDSALFMHTCTPWIWIWGSLNKLNTYNPHQSRIIIHVTSHAVKLLLSVWINLTIWTGDVFCMFGDRLAAKLELLLFFFSVWTMIYNQKVQNRQSYTSIHVTDHT